MQIAPPTTTVEIKSMPIAGVDSASAPPGPETDAQAQPTDGGLIRTIRGVGYVFTGKIDR